MSDDTTRRAVRRRASEQSLRIARYAQHELSKAMDSGDPRSIDLALDAVFDKLVTKVRTDTKRHLESAWTARLGDLQRQIEMLKRENAELRSQLAAMRGGR